MQRDCQRLTSELDPSFGGPSNSQLISNKGTKVIQWERIVFSTNDAGIIRDPDGKISESGPFTRYTKQLEMKKY